MHTHTKYEDAQEAQLTYINTSPDSYRASMAGICAITAPMIRKVMCIEASLKVP